ncbi:MAG TPA: hypothetical protein VFM18_14955 [Methanosarcina sp.]|nr:hypothetical protein [Methanosarcina sp.]
MSRTYRRKGYEKTQNTSWDKQFNSIAGFYTEYDYELINPYLKYSYFNKTYRTPTKQEFSQKYWDVHADGRYGYGRFSRYWRIESNRRVRRSNDREILKWMKNQDHEVMLQTGDDVLDIWFYD